MIPSEVKKILIVDDTPIVVETLTDLLTLQGYRVFEAADAMQATMQAVKMKPHLVLLDIMMPAGGGMAVYQRLLKNPETHQIPILFLSGYPLETLQGTIPVLDRDHFMAKPWDNEQLLAAIKRLIERSPENSSSTNSFY